MPEMDSASRRFRFLRSHRLSGARAFSAVYDAKMRKNVGPLSVLTRPNGLMHARLGLSVSRKVGSAVVRNRVKRLVREAYRLNQHDWPSGLDVVVVVRPHEPAALEEYVRWLGTGVTLGAANWAKRGGDVESGKTSPAIEEQGDGA